MYWPQFCLNPNNYSGPLHIHPFAFACAAQTVINTFSGLGNKRNVTSWYSCILRLKGWYTVGESRLSISPLLVWFRVNKITQKEIFIRVRDGERERERRRDKDKRGRGFERKVTRASTRCLSLEDTALVLLSVITAALYEKVLYHCLQNLYFAMWYTVALS